MSTTIQYIAFLKNKNGHKECDNGMENAISHVIGIVSPVENGFSGTYIVKVGVKSYC